MRKHAVLAAVAVVAACLLPAGRAQATFAGANGPIQFAADGRLYETTATSAKPILSSMQLALSVQQAPNGTLLASGIYAGDDVDIWTFKRGDDASNHWRTELIWDGCHPSWAPDSKRFVFMSGVPSCLMWPSSDDIFGTLKVYEPGDQTNGRPLYAVEGDDARDPSWAPVGNLIAFVTDRTGTYQVHLIRPDGTGLRQLTFDSGDKSWPSFHPSGNKIIYTKGGDLWQVSVWTGVTKRLTSTAATETSGVFSPDGTKIAFVRAGVLHKMRSDGTNVVVVPTGGVTGVRSVSWATR